MKPIITSAMLRKRRPAAPTIASSPAVNSAAPAKRELRASRDQVEPTSEHPAFRAPQLGIRQTDSE
jgi:hypothetical protein